MVTPRGLLDTCVLIDYERMDVTEMPDLSLISTVTLAELTVGPLVAPNPPEIAVRQSRLRWAHENFDPLPFDVDCANAFGQVSADLRAAGRTAQSRTYDAMIAATALANNLPLFTLNPDDFAGITGLDLRVLTLEV